MARVMSSVARLLLAVQTVFILAWAKPLTAAEAGAEV